LPASWADLSDTLLGQQLKGLQEQRMGEAEANYLAPLFASLNGQQASPGSQVPQPGTQQQPGDLASLTGQPSSPQQQPLGALNQLGQPGMQNGPALKPGRAADIAKFITTTNQAAKGLAETSRHHGELEKQGERRLGLEETKLATTQEQLNNKRHEDLIMNIKNNARLAPNGIRNSEAIISLTKTGKLNSGPWRNALAKVQWIADAFNNPETDATKTLMAERTGNILRAVGPKNVSEGEARIFQNMGPAIFQTEAGIIFNAKNDIIAHKEAIQENKEYQEILSKNNNKIPANLDELLEKRMEPYRKKYAQEFKNNLNQLINKEVPKPNVANYPVGTILTHPITGAQEVVALDPKGRKITMPKNGGV
jgi:hypothetical protein